MKENSPEDQDYDISSKEDDIITFKEARNKLVELGYTTWDGSYNGVFACYLPSMEIAKSVENFVSQQLSLLLILFISC